MSYCNIDEAYDTPFDNLVMKYDEMLKRDVKSLNSSPKFNQDNIFTAQGDLESSLHVGTNISDLKRGCDNLPCESYSSKSITKKSHAISPNEQNCQQPRKLRSVKCGVPQTEKTINDESDQETHTSRYNKAYDQSDKYSRHDQSHISTRKYQKSQHKSSRGRDDNLSCMISKYINCRDIKELLFVIMMGIIMIFLMDLIAKLSKKL